MHPTRRQWISAAAGTAAAGWLPTLHAQAGALKISHQFPSGSLTVGDFRDRLCRRFAAEVDKRSSGALKAAVYPGSSLMKTNAQFSAMRKGALDMSLVPLSYAGGEVAETNAGLMPALVPSYEQGAAWKLIEALRCPHFANHNSCLHGFALTSSSFSSRARSRASGVTTTSAPRMILV